MIISVIVPTYNRKDKVKKCIQSLQNQKFAKSKYEIIIVDDASTDGTYRSLSRMDGVVLLRLKQRSGPAAARNFGVMKAKGKYVAFTDSDCEVPENWLKSIHDGFNDYPKVVAVGGGVISHHPSIFSKYENYIYEQYVKKAATYISSYRNEMPFALGNICYSKDFLMDLGGFNEKLPYYVSGEDADLKERALKKKKKFLYIPVNVIHNHDFCYKDFYYQSLSRGAGMLYDSKKRGKMQSILAILMRLVFTPMYVFVSLKNLKSKLTLVPIDVLFYFFRNLGKLKYYSNIKKMLI